MAEGSLEGTFLSGGLKRTVERLIEWHKHCCERSRLLNAHAKNAQRLERVESKKSDWGDIVGSFILGLLFCSTFIGAAQASEAPANSIHYTVKPLVGVKRVDALEVEVRIRQASGNKIDLDQVIFRMRDRWASAPIDGRPAVLENLKASHHDLLGSDDQLDATIESYITQGEFVRLPVDMFGQCATIDPSEPPYGQGAQTVRLRPIDEQQRVVCARTLP